MWQPNALNLEIRYLSDVGKVDSIYQVRSIESYSDGRYVTCLEVFAKELHLKLLIWKIVLKDFSIWKFPNGEFEHLRNLSNLLRPKKTFIENLENFNLKLSN